ncbi:hypothetical protein EDD63_11215 [Breznakia blatticola]|uniref:Uncharacterized protein n=1 Tax=Breznakia blatticola TaxID=1754012 RepID=A0A4R7ZRJ2_9FIRM|nr:AtpZ/AtpI family protein [Breznakia blatticola]TDW20549.1 hypothetical protein EDD63_11215 [Breznakia blatticola]
MKQMEATRFVGRVVLGSILAVFGGLWLDDTFGTKPWIMLGLLLYVLVGSLITLVKDVGDSNEK